MICNKSIKNIHSFSLNNNAIGVKNIYNTFQLYNIYNKFLKKNINSIIIGNGTNSIFLENFYGYILINNIIGIKILEKRYNWIIHINSGENWNNIVNFTLKNNIYGLENLAMIPGKVGAAPIYNIGAYNSEFKDFCIYVDILNLKSGKIYRIKKKYCYFSYRYSIFQKLCNKFYFILAIGLSLSKKWKPNISHSIFKEFFIKNINKINPNNIFEFVCYKRKINIPDIKTFGNSGSIFKNPIIDIYKLNKIKLEYKNIPYILEKKNKYKISAGWLIEKCGLKNFNIGNVSTSNKNAIIIINLGNAKGSDLIKLIKLIFNTVKFKFNIKLELEVSLISKYKKIKLEDII